MSDRSEKDKTPARRLAEHLHKQISSSKTDEANLAAIERAFQELLDQWKARLDQARAQGEEALAAAVAEERRKHQLTLQELKEAQGKIQDLKTRLSKKPA